MEHLRPVQFCVQAVAREQLGVISLLDDTSFSHDKYGRRLSDCREAMRDDESRAADKKPLERFLDQRFGLGV